MHTHSGGIPRLVNILCDNGLLSAYARNKKSVEPEMIGEIARDLHITVSQEASAARRKSVTGKPKETSLESPKENILDLAYRAEQKRHAPADSQPFPPKLILRGEPPGGGPSNKYAKQFENGAIRRVESVTDTVPHRFFESMMPVLAEAVGPMAAVILDDHIAALGESKEVFPKRRLGQLFERMTREILNDSMKGRFQQLMFKELDTMVGGANQR